MNEGKLFDLIRKPIITEKTTMQSEFKKYTFKILTDANKDMVKKSIEKIFSVKVSKVNIINTKGKEKRFKGRVGYRADVKKAVVTLESGYSIDYGGGVK